MLTRKKTMLEHIHTKTKWGLEHISLSQVQAHLQQPKPLPQRHSVFESRGSGNWQWLSTSSAPGAVLDALYIF